MVGPLRRAAEAVALPARPWWPLLPLGMISVVGLTVLVTRPADWRAEPLLFSALAMVMGAVALAGWWLARTRRLPVAAVLWIVAVGIVLNLLATGLSHSDDANRYVVEGRQILAGDNPYAIAPADARAVALVSPEISAAVNHPEMTAIYPPAALFAHAAAQLIAPGFLGLKILCCAGALLAIGLVLTLLIRWRQPPGLVVAVAWSPVLPIFASGEVHHDILMAVLVLAALQLVSARHHAAAAITLALAILVKPFAAVLVPVLARELPKRHWWLIPATVVLAYLPFIGAGPQLFASTATFAGTMHFHGVLDPWVRLALTPLIAAEWLEAAVRVVLGVTLLSGLALLWRRRSRLDLPGLAAGALGILLLCLPTLHPWYFMVLVVLLPFTSSWGLALWTASAGIYWLHGLAILRAHGAWSETLWVTALAHLPALAVLIWEACAVRPAHRDNVAHG